MEKSYPNSIKSAVAAAALAAAAMMSLAGCVGTSTASEADAALVGVYTNPASVFATPDDTELMLYVRRTISIEISGPGHVEPKDNCKIDGTSFRVLDVSEKSSFELCPDADGVTVNVLDADNHALTRDGNLVEVPAGYSGKIVVQFVEPAPPEPVPVPETAPAAEPVYEPVYEPVSPAPAVSQPEPEPVPAAEPAYVAPVYEKYPGVVFDSVPREDGRDHNSMMQGIISNPHAMNDEEATLAREIFDEYNALRIRYGKAPVKWSNDLCNIAYYTSIANSWQYNPQAEKHGLQHLLIIGEPLKYDICDILQYSSWKKTAADAVSRWEGSYGHFRMMKCNTAQVAGVGVYYNEEKHLWYYTIVYDFVSRYSNQSD